MYEIHVQRERGGFESVKRDPPRGPPYVRLRREDRARERPVHEPGEPRCRVVLHREPVCVCVCTHARLANLFAPERALAEICVYACVPRERA